MTTNGYHPICSGCLKSGELYFEWVDICKEHKKGTDKYETACLRYRWHVAGCDVCQRGLKDD